MAAFPIATAVSAEGNGGEGGKLIRGKEKEKKIDWAADAPGSV